MGTRFEDIYDLALVVIQDYKLDNIYKTESEIFYTFMRGLLTVGIPDFNGCLNDLSYNSEEIEFLNESGEPIKRTVYFFNNELTLKEKSILSKIIVYNWFKNKVQDVTQFQLHLSTRDFQIKSEQANLKQKSEYLDKLKEDYLQEINEYQGANLDMLPFFGDL